VPASLFFVVAGCCTLGLPAKLPVYAQLARDFIFTPPLKYFLQVKLNFTEQGVLSAHPIEGNGSGDFANLADADAFMELPLENNEFKAREVFKVWRF
jgi:molybdopterin molybdotransferase